MTAPVVKIETDRPDVLVVSGGPDDATTTLFFGHLKPKYPNAMRVVADRDWRIPSLLARASAVVIVRALFEFPALRRAAAAIRVPQYYFLDDNFVVLREHDATQLRFVERYSMPAVRAALRGFAGVLLASPALVDYFVAHGLHHHIRLFPPVTSTASVPSPHGTGLRVAFFGGRHLHGIFLETIVPAVRRLAQDRPVTLVAVGIPGRIETSQGMRVVQLPYHASYSRGVAALAAEGVDLLVHPVASGLANNAYKNPHALITAHALEAVPVVSDVPPYDGLAEAGVALLCNESEGSWYEALSRAAGDEQLKSVVRTGLARYCREHFNGRTNLEVLDEIRRTHSAPLRHTTWLRSGMARALLFDSQLRRVAAHVRGAGRDAGVA